MCIYIYIHICIHKHILYTHAGVCEKNTPPEHHTHWNRSLLSTKSGAGEQFLLWDCRAKSSMKGVLFHRHR